MNKVLVLAVSAAAALLVSAGVRADPSSGLPSGSHPAWVALNPQPEPPGATLRLNPQPEPPGATLRLNPQPEPPGRW